MAKYMILYNSDVTASALMKDADLDQMKASMAEWIAWKDEAEKKAKFEFGMPMEVTARVTAGGAAETSHNPASGYSFIEGEKNAIVDLLKSHPHLKRPGASIDLLEILPMPGID